MSQSRLDRLILVLVAVAFAAGSMLAPASALAAQALFRIENRWHNFPNPAITTPGNAGLGMGWVQPYVYLTKTKATPIVKSPPGNAQVQPGNPIGSPFTLETAFYVFDWEGTLWPKTAWEGYTTYYRYAGYNGPGKFGPNFGPTTTTRLVFPTTGGNPTPNTGQGNPVYPTTTYGGRYDLSRGGSIHVQPGPNRFGGTYRMFFDDVAGWYQWIYKFYPQYFKGYGYYFCWDDGMRDCTPQTFESEPGTTAIYSGYWWLLNKTGTGTGARTAKNTAKATKAATYYGIKPTVGGAGTPTYGNQASYVWQRQMYLNLIHPWTTGFASAVFAPGNQDTGVITPQQQGYDTSLGGADITVTYFDYNQNYNPGKGTTTTTYTYKQYLSGVTRVVSLVRPRVVWTLQRPLDPVNQAITNIWNPVRLWNMRVFFLPEPAGMLLLGVGIAAVLGLSRLRRR